MTRAYWNGSSEDWLHGDEHWSHDIVEEAEQDAADDYLPIGDEELKQMRAEVKDRTLKANWLRLQREFPAIERTKA